MAEWVVVNEDAWMIKCEKCGTVIESVEVDIFDHEGNDYWCDVGFYEHENGIYLDLPFNWCGHEFDDDDEEDDESEADIDESDEDDEDDGE